MHRVTQHYLSDLWSWECGCHSLLFLVVVFGSDTFLVHIRSLHLYVCVSKKINIHTYNYNIMYVNIYIYTCFIVYLSISLSLRALSLPLDSSSEAQKKQAKTISQSAHQPNSHQTIPSPPAPLFPLDTRQLPREVILMDSQSCCTNSRSPKASLGARSNHQLNANLKNYHANLGDPK